jgi:hypothetical protein
MADPLRSEKDLHEVQVSLQELEEVLMRIVGGLDIHRQQVTFDWVDLDTGEPKRGRITPADRVGFRKWLGQFDGEVEVVLEGLHRLAVHRRGMRRGRGEGACRGSRRGRGAA